MLSDPTASAFRSSGATRGLSAFVLFCASALPVQAELMATFEGNVVVPGESQSFSDFQETPQSVGSAGPNAPTGSLASLRSFATFEDDVLSFGQSSGFFGAGSATATTNLSLMAQVIPGANLLAFQIEILAGGLSLLGANLNDSVGVSFNIDVEGVDVFSASASITETATGPEFAFGGSTADLNGFAQGSTEVSDTLTLDGASWGNTKGLILVDLGASPALDSLNINYSLETFAIGTTACTGTPCATGLVQFDDPGRFGRVLPISGPPPEDPSSIFPEIEFDFGVFVENVARFDLPPSVTPFDPNRPFVPPTAVSEPSTLGLMLGSVLIALGIGRRRLRRA